jgi:hypothetical protein
MTTSEHVGLTALESERAKLLSEYDTALQQGSDDAVRTEHGVSCEAHFRTFLGQFLPRKYGVTKGYIITPDLAYAGPLEEWDIIIYDAIESPVLFVRQTRDENERAGKQGIPIEYVRAVVEVKATFNADMATKAAAKLLRLRQLAELPPGRSPKNKNVLSSSFRAFAVFFETKVDSSQEYQNALSALTALWRPEPTIAFRDALILRAPNHPDSSARIFSMWTGNPDLASLLAEGCETSQPLPCYDPEMFAYAVSGGFGRNEFWEYMISMVYALNGDDIEQLSSPEYLTGGYGIRPDSHRRVRL